MTNYTPEFYKQIEAGSLRSARIVVPLLANRFSITSVMDVGCGTGAWLKAWQENRVANISGIDGAYLKDIPTLIDKTNISFMDLDALTLTNQPEYSIVQCLEVAEHLKPESAYNFIHQLTKLSNLILFSAAIPGQGGVDHFNEQYPSYWANIFNKYKYYPIDIIRSKIWYDTNIEIWYRQNIMLYANVDAITKFSLNYTPTTPLDIVHPEYFKIYRR